MSDFEVGDKVRVVYDHSVWLTEGSFQLSNDSVLTVVDKYNADLADNEIWIDNVNEWPADFVLVNGGFVSANTTYVFGEEASEMVMPITRNTTGVTPPSGMIADTAAPARFGSFHAGAVIDLPPEVERTLLAGYKEALTKSHEERDPEILGVYRPNLEDRKVGKVRVELVDDGFPLALREIAKVMTWAQTAKGYKDHDWQNIPNPEQALSGATSRHRTDHIIQRQVDDVEAIECVDHESSILHKAHEAFGVLAQLELILRGVIK